MTHRNGYSLPVLPAEVHDRIAEGNIEEAFKRLSTLREDIEEHTRTYDPDKGERRTKEQR